MLLVFSDKIWKPPIIICKAVIVPSGSVFIFDKKSFSRIMFCTRHIMLYTTRMYCGGGSICSQKLRWLLGFVFNYVNFTLFIVCYCSFSPRATNHNSNQLKKKNLNDFWLLLVVNTNNNCIIGLIYNVYRVPHRGVL